VGFTESVVVRTIEFSDVQGFNHQMSYEPSIYVKVYAIFDDGTKEGNIGHPNAPSCMAIQSANLVILQ